MSENCFIVLGGGDEIGASCYYLEIDENRFILDAGMRINKEEKYPEFNLITQKNINGYNDVDAVIISHAHYDHIGALPYLFNLVGSNTKFYTTQITKDLIKLQLIAFNRDSNETESLKVRNMKRLQTMECIDNINVRPLMRPLKVGKSATVTFYPAGHMTGAVMTYIETPNHKILYTGDFCLDTASNINNCRYDGLTPDTLILSSTYGYRPYTIKNNDERNLILEIETQLRQGNNIMLVSGNLAKQLDTFYLINSCDLPADVYIDKNLEPSAEAFSELGYTIYSPTVKGYVKKRPNPHILFTACTRTSDYNYKVINADLFSVHASYDDLIKFITKINAKKTFMVHTQPKEQVTSIQDEIISRRTFKGEVIQSHNGYIYKL